MSDRTDRLELMVNGCELCGENPTFVNSKGIRGEVCQECYENTCIKCGDEIYITCPSCGQGGGDIEDYENN